MRTTHLCIATVMERSSPTPQFGTPITQQLIDPEAHPLRPRVPPRGATRCALNPPPRRSPLRLCNSMPRFSRQKPHRRSRLRYIHQPRPSPGAPLSPRT